MTSDEKARKAWAKRQAAAKRREDIRAKAIAYLGGKCRICGYNRSPAAFDFHHVNPHSKRFNISAATSWKKAEPELAKCVLLCSNCHREVHAGLHPEYLQDDYDHYREYDSDDPYVAYFGTGPSIMRGSEDG